MTESKLQTVAVGDLFRDNDPRHQGRIVRVDAIAVDDRRRDVVRIENVEHWNEHLIGRHTWISRDRLELGRNRMTGYTKVSH